MRNFRKSCQAPADFEVLGTTRTCRFSGIENKQHLRIQIPKTSPVGTRILTKNRTSLQRLLYVYPKLGPFLTNKSLNQAQNSLETLNSSSYGKKRSGTTTDGLSSSKFMRQGRRNIWGHGGLIPTNFGGDKLTLYSNPGGADYAHHISQWMVLEIFVQKIFKMNLNFR